MGDLQVTVEILLDLGRLYNVDIFQRGFYWVSFALLEPTPITSKVEVHLIKNGKDVGFCPPKSSPTGATTKVVHVLRRKEVFSLEHGFLFRIHVLVDSRNILACLADMKFRFEATLCFSATDNWNEENLKTFEAVSKQNFILHVDPLHGVHAHSLIIFEYMYMAAVGMTVHASVVALHQPLMSMPGLKSSQKGAKSYYYENPTLESILYRADATSMQAGAIQLHTDVIKILFSIYANMNNYFKKLQSCLSTIQQSDFDVLDAEEKFKELTSQLLLLSDRDEIINQVDMDLASTCSRLLGLWSHILNIVCLNRQVVRMLAVENHHHHVTRLRSTVFTLTNPRKEYDENRFSAYSWIGNYMKSSKFFQELPSLDVEFLEKDGSKKELPILFEDRYTNACAKSPLFLPRDKLPPPSASSTNLPPTSTSDDEDKTIAPNQHPSKVPWDSPWNGKEQLLLSQFDDDEEDPEKEEMTTLYDFLFGMGSESTGASPVPERKFSDEISHKVCEEPEEFDFQNNFLGKTNGNNHQPSTVPHNASLFCGPGFVSSKKQEAAEQQSNVVEAFGVRSSESLSKPSATTTMLSPEDEPEVNLMFPAPATSGDGEPAFGRHVNDRSSPEQRLQAVQKSSVLSAVSNGASIKQCVLYDDCDLPTLKQSKSLQAKQALLEQLKYPGDMCVDIEPSVPCVPYLVPCRTADTKHDYKYRSHFIVLVHGLDGSCNDLRLVRTYLQLGLDAVHRSRGMPTSATYLLSEINERDTYDSIQHLADKLVIEILNHMRFHYSHESHPKRISFIGHSLGGLVIRTAITDDRLKHLRSRFYTFLSLASPHLGSMFNSSTLVNTGMWLMQKWKKSDCLLQLGFKDSDDLRRTFLYQLSERKGLEFFKHILLVASEDDRYVPYHSARIEMCKLAQKSKEGQVYQEMVNNTLNPIWKNPDIKLIRYHVVHNLQPNTANTMIGRAAHIAVLDSASFLEQFFLVSALQYFI